MYTPSRITESMQSNNIIMMPPLLKGRHQAVNKAPSTASTTRTAGTKPSRCAVSLYLALSRQPAYGLFRQANAAPV